MRELLARYKNGNYNVKLYSDGTKVRFGKEMPFQAVFPENIDIKITDYCDAGCAFCHENSTIKGQHAVNLLSHPFLDTLRPGTELAIGGGNPMSHPHLELFLQKMKYQGVICNLTVNAVHLPENQARLAVWMRHGLVKGLGLSVNRYDQQVHEFATRFTGGNVVLHIINGVMPYEDLKKYYGPEIKALLLGYKMFRRGEKAYSEQTRIRMEEFHENLLEILNSFHTVSFDNLGIAQLKPQRFMSPEEWNTFYMGDDGSHTMYIDMVQSNYAKNSTSLQRYMLDNTIEEMFAVVRNS